jgi:hypothetical protein
MTNDRVSQQNRQSANSWQAIAAAVAPAAPGIAEQARAIAAGLSLPTPPVKPSRLHLAEPIIETSGRVGYCRTCDRKWTTEAEHTQHDDHCPDLDPPKVDVPAVVRWLAGERIIDLTGAA